MEEAALEPRLAVFGSQRERYANSEQAQSYGGIAPATERSGEEKWVHFRRACPTLSRQSFHELQQQERESGTTWRCEGWP